MLLILFYIKLIKVQWIFIAYFRTSIINNMILYIKRFAQ